MYPVSITEEGKKYQGDLILPPNAAAKGPLPLVVVVHEWWGKTPYAISRGQQVAHDLGYAALVVDLYGDAKTTEAAQEAQTLATPFFKRPMEGVERIRHFIAAAPKIAEGAGASLDLTKIAAIGYCFGGTQVLNLARAGDLPSSGGKKEELLGVVSFHGGLTSTLHATSPIHAKILVLHGAADQMVSSEDVENFKAEMKKDHADVTVIAYPGAEHAFTNPNATDLGKRNHIPIAYNEAADHASWQEMTKFLKKLYAQ